MLHFATVCVPN